MSLLTRTPFIQSHPHLINSLKKLAWVGLAFAIFMFIYSIFYYHFVEQKETQFIDHLFWWLKSFGVWFLMAPLTLIGLTFFQFKIPLYLNLIAFGIPNVAFAAASRVYFDYLAYADNLMGYYILFIPSQTGVFCFLALFWYWFVYQKCLALPPVTKAEKLNRRLKDKAPAIQVEHMGRQINLPFSDVLYLKSAGNYIEVTSQNNEYLKRATLKDLQQDLPDYFLQIHRSHIVNLKRVNRVHNTSSGIAIVTMSDQQQLNVSKALKSTLKKQLNEYPQAKSNCV